jgi:hypothetical protein
MYGMQNKKLLSFFFEVHDANTGQRRPRGLILRTAADISKNNSSQKTEASDNKST